MASQSVLQTHHLTKTFDDCNAVTNVNLELQAGDRLALIGNNGAGKTTLLKLLVGLLLPTSGSVSIMGHDLLTQPELAKSSIGYMPDDPSAYDYLTGLEFLTLTGRLRRLPATAIKQAIAKLRTLFPIAELLEQPMSRYSRGNKQKVAFLAALLAQPKILIIDEPIVGLDSDSITTMGTTLEEYTTKGNAVIFVTHIVAFASTYATKIAVMNHGSVTTPQLLTTRQTLKQLLQHHDHTTS